VGPGSKKGDDADLREVNVNNGKGKDGGDSQELGSKLLDYAESARKLGCTEGNKYWR